MWVAQKVPVIVLIQQKYWLVQQMVKRLAEPMEPSKLFVALELSWVELKELELVVRMAKQLAEETVPPKSAVKVELSSVE